MVSHPSSCSEQAVTAVIPPKPELPWAAQGSRRSWSPNLKNEVGFKFPCKQVKIMRKFVQLEVLWLSLLLSETGQRIQDSKH